MYQPVRSGGQRNASGRVSYSDGSIENVTDNADCLDDDLGLVAGTSWLFAREEFDGALDYLVVDEAGQIALADVVAAGAAARNLIILGDPQQLRHVTQAIHPEGVGGSVLEHVLGEDETVRPERGLFLPTTCGRSRASPGWSKKRSVSASTCEERRARH